MTSNPTAPRPPAAESAPALPPDVELLRRRCELAWPRWLTDREFDILLLVAEGMDNQAIARRLVLSPKTVRNHVSNVFAKIQAPDRPGAIVLAHRAGLGT